VLNIYEIVKVSIEERFFMFHERQGVGPLHGAAFALSLFLHMYHATLYFWAR
jgi:hypothetical protein